MLEILHANTKFGKTAFSFCAAHTWNILQRTLNLNIVVPTGQFKTMITNCSAVFNSVLLLSVCLFSCYFFVCIFICVF